MTITETDPSKLPQWKGRPVPWITAWKGQESPHRPQIVQLPSGRPAYTYRDPNEIRDEYGMLWQHEGANRAGDPMFKVVSTYRQRRCMKHRVCQVCGDKIADKVEGGETPWLVDRIEWEAMQEAQEKGAPVLTVTAPVCPPCIPLATRLCPQLVRTGYQLLRVEAYEIWGVWGRTLINNEIIFGAVGYDEKQRIPMTLAHQQMVELIDFTWLEEWA